MLEIPSFEKLLQITTQADPDKILYAQETLNLWILAKLEDELLQIYTDVSSELSKVVIQNQHKTWAKDH